MIQLQVKKSEDLQGCSTDTYMPYIHIAQNLIFMKGLNLGYVKYNILTSEFTDCSPGYQ